MAFRNEAFTALSCFTADSTGTHSLYTTYKDYELMFHVSTMLPYTPNNRQQVSKLHTLISSSRLPCLLYCVVSRCLMVVTVVPEQLPFRISSIPAPSKLPQRLILPR